MKYDNYMVLEQMLTVRRSANGTEFSCGTELMRLTIRDSVTGAEWLRYRMNLVNGTGSIKLKGRKGTVRIKFGKYYKNQLTVRSGDGTELIS